MLNKTQIQELEKIIGYKFKDKELLSRAFCHSSFANENGEKSNERLEFLGDSVLNFVITKELFFKTEVKEKNEGELTIIRAETVSKKPLSELTKKLGLMQFLQLGEGAKNEKKISTKFYSNIIEAVIGAIFLDSDGGIDNAESFILKNLKLNLTDTRIDYKTTLQEILQKNKETWKYTTYEFNSGFKSELKFSAGKFEGEGLSKKDAEQKAAAKALQAVNEKSAK